MRPFMAIVGALVVASGCTSRYHVDRSELMEARYEKRGIVPARDAVGDETWLEVDAIARERNLTADLLEVQATDSRPGLRIAGWSVAGLGLLTAANGGARLADAGRYTEGSLDALFNLVIGGTITLLGAALLIPGYAGDGPETEPPAPAESPIAPVWR